MSITNIVIILFAISLCACVYSIYIYFKTKDFLKECEEHLALSRNLERSAMKIAENVKEKERIVLKMQESVKQQEKVLDEIERNIEKQQKMFDSQRERFFSEDTTKCCTIEGVLK